MKYILRKIHEETEDVPLNELVEAEVKIKLGEITIEYDAPYGGHITQYYKGIGAIKQFKYDWKVNGKKI